MIKKIWEIIKKFWWIILAVMGFVVGINLAKKKEKEQLKVDLERIKQQKEERQKELEKELEKLKKEADEIEKTDRFDNPDNAVDYLNNILRRIQDDQKKR